MDASSGSIPSPLPSFGLFFHQSPVVGPNLMHPGKTRFHFSVRLIELYQTIQGGSRNRNRVFGSLISGINTPLLPCRPWFLPHHITFSCPLPYWKIKRPRKGLACRQHISVAVKMMRFLRPEFFLFHIPGMKQSRPFFCWTQKTWRYCG